MTYPHQQPDEREWDVKPVIKFGCWDCRRNGIMLADQPQKNPCPDCGGRAVYYTSQPPAGFMDKQQELMKVARAAEKAREAEDKAQRRRNEEAKRGVLVVVFVHGWQHNAMQDRGNLAWFRGLVVQMAERGA